MAKQPVHFDPPNSPPPKVHKHEPLHPSKISSANDHATVSGLLLTLSPIKPARFFDGELTDGKSTIGIVGFDKAKLHQIQPY